MLPRRNRYTCEKNYSGEKLLDLTNLSDPSIAVEELIPRNRGDHDTTKYFHSPISKVSLHIEMGDQPPKDIGEKSSLNGSHGGGDKENATGEPVRAAWGGQLEFILTCVGYAVGLGNVWRFPYLCYKNGGGAFLVPYVLMLILVGLPLFFMELAFGQFASLGPISVWKVNRTLKGLGYAMVSVSWLMSVYYNVIIAHVLLFLFVSLAAIPTQLPWITCGNYWNTPTCIGPIHGAPDGNLLQNGTMNGTANWTEPGAVVYDGMARGVMEEPMSLNVTSNEYVLSDIGNASITGKSQTAAEEFYMYYVLEQSSGMETPGPINWKVAMCLMLAWAIVLVSLIKGIASLGKVVYFTAIFPYIMLLVMLVRSVTLPGSVDGIIYYLYPDFSRLGEARVWSDAATQIFYSLGTCTGGLVAMSSYNKFHNNCIRDALLVAFINCGTSILAGFVIFSVLGFMALEKGVSVSDVAAGGPGLAFVVYPEALSKMPGSQFWSICFFIMMATLGFGSQMSFCETVLSAFTDEFPSMLRGKYPNIIWRSSVIIFTFLLGLPMCTTSGIYLLNLVDYSLSGFPLLIVGVMEVVAINWIYGYKRFAEDIELMLGKRPSLFFQVCWKGVTPFIIVITIVFNMVKYKPPSLDNYIYPQWAEHLGFAIAFFPVSLIIMFFLWSYCRKGGYKLLCELSEPKAAWGPALHKDRLGRYASTEMQDEGTQIDLATMWTQTRIILACTPMPSTHNLAVGSILMPSSHNLPVGSTPPRTSPLNLAVGSTPRTSTLNLSGLGLTTNMVSSSTSTAVGTPCTIPLSYGVDADEIISAVQRARQKNGSLVVEAAAGTPDDPFFLPPQSPSITPFITTSIAAESGSTSSVSNPVAIPSSSCSQRPSLILADIPEGKPLTTFALPASSVP